MATSNTSAGFNWTLGLGIGLILILFMVFSLPSLIVLSIGLLPTAVAFIVDRSDHKSGAFCVGGMNFSGVLPFIIKLWSESHTVIAAIEIISDIFSLLIMYAAAGFGWMMFLAIPPVISSFLTVISQTRVKVLRANQQKIVDEWGPGVITSSEDLEDKVIEEEISKTNDQNKPDPSEKNEMSLENHADLN